MNLERIGEKNFKKKEKGTGAAGPTRLPFGPASSPACLPLPSLSRARRPPRPIQRRPRGGRTPALGAPRPATSTPPGRDADPRPQTTPSILSPAPLPPPSVRAAATAAVPPRAIAGASPAARRRPQQSFKLDAKSPSALAVAAVSPCVRSTEVRSSRAP